MVNVIPNKDAEVVERLLAEGAVFVDRKHFFQFSRI